MEAFPWWSEEQRRLADEVEEFVDGIMWRAEEARWKREFPWDIVKRMAERGYFGAGISEEYGGMGLGATGACIASEEMCRIPGLGQGVFINTMLGGLRQTIEFGTEEQKRRFLPRIAKGEIGAICITEPFVGSDAAGTETVAQRDGDKYIITGKKRFTTGVGVASRYMLYARTSDEVEDRRRYRHLTAFIVEKGMPGFTVEKVNELICFDNMQNGCLNLDEVPVPVDNRIGEEGQGWSVMTTGLNYERTLIAAASLGQLRTLIRAVVPYAQRRVQFGRPTIDLVNNQFKIADLFMTLKLARLATYYTAYLLDLGQDAALESAICKTYNTDSTVEASLNAIQVMGADGVTKFYPLEGVLRQSKTDQIAGGTNEIGRLLIYRMGLREMAKELKMPRRVVHNELGVPLTTFESAAKQSRFDEDTLLKVLAEDYRVNPGLYMSREDLKEAFDVEDEELDQALASLEQKKLVNLYRSRGQIMLAKATYEGLRKAHPPEYYRWFPPWVRKEDIF